MYILRFLKTAAAVLSVLPYSGVAEESEPTFSVIFDMPSVQYLTFDSGAKELFAVADNRLMRWTLGPPRLSTVVKIDTLASDLAIGPSGTLFLAGQRWNSETLQVLGGSFLAFPKTDGGKNMSRFSLYDDNTDNGNTGGQLLAYSRIGLFSSIAFDNADNVIMGSPVANSVSIRPARKVPITPGTNFAFFTLECGATNDLSVVEIEQRSYYFSSSVNGAILEFGSMPVEGDEPDVVQCFRVVNVFSEQKQVPTFNSLQHIIIDLPFDEDASPSSGKAVLVLEPNVGKLYLFPIESFDGKLSLSRTTSIEIDLTRLNPGVGQGITFTKLAAAADGSTIYVSSSAAKYVLRFALEDGKLRSRGRIAMSASVRRLEISADGAFAAIVTGDSFLGGDQKITIITNPALVPDRASIPNILPAVLLLQQALNEAGFHAGTPDGRLGVHTRKAVDAYLTADETQTANGSDGNLFSLIGGVIPARVLQ